MRNHTTKHSRRRGYTLMEMITVQAVLVALLALSWPALRGSLQKNSLVDAAKQLRTELLKARQSAIDTGVPHRLRYRPASPNFEVVEVNAPSATTVAGSVATRATARPSSDRLASNPGESEQSTPVAIPRHLPATIHFAGPCVAPRSEAPVPAPVPSTEATNDPATASSQEDWAPPVTFYPNGRATNAKFRLEGPDKHYVELALRGVTGTVAISEIRHEVAEADHAEVR